jgi:hypothetical protein
MRQLRRRRRLGLTTVTVEIDPAALAPALIKLRALHPDHIGDGAAIGRAIEKVCEMIPRLPALQTDDN